MPHKRAKQSIRLALQEKRGSDLPPTRKDKEGDSERGGVSKSMYRVLNAEKIRNERKAKRAVQTAEDGPRKKIKRDQQSLQLHPHESLRSFNQRVEEDFRPGLSTAYRVSRQAEARENKKRKRQRVEDTQVASTEHVSPALPPPTDATARERPKEWAAAPRRTRLNDVAMEPPSLGRAARQQATGVDAHRSPVSMAQRAAIDEERLRAIAKYRELRDARQATSGFGLDPARPTRGM